MRIKLLLFAVVVSFVFSRVNAQINVGDSMALVNFFDSGHLSHYTWWHEENWKTAAPVSTWYGVTVTDNRVTALRLPVNSINGVIPESFGNLTKIEYVDLDYNPAIRGTANNDWQLRKPCSFRCVEPLPTDGENTGIHCKLQPASIPEYVHNRHIGIYTRKYG